jgi:uncharacterized phage-associated protein
MDSETTTSFPEKSPDERLGELMLYIAAKCESTSNFSATKLNKILYFSDFVYYQRTGQPVTGSEYIKEKYGPVPKRLLPIRKKLVANKEAAIKKSTTISGLEQHRLIPLREPDLTKFSAAEIDVVDRVIAACNDQNAKQLSELSHDRVWRIAEMGQPIPYEAVFVSDDNPTAEDVKRGIQLIEERKWSV